jgi:S1-C subfamily serine protease
VTPSSPARTNDLTSGCVNDQRILTALTDQLTKLWEGGQSVQIKKLQQQLSRKSCVLDLPPIPNARLNPASLYQQCKPGVLVAATLYKCPKCGRFHVNAASGFLVSASGVFATSYHVVDQADQATMGAMTPDGKVWVVREVLAANKQDDVALLQLEGSGFHPLSLSSGDPIGSPVTVISHPDNNFYALTQGVISRNYLQDEKGVQSPRLGITADFAKGSSGAPVFNEFGCVIGMVCSTHSIYYNVENGQEKNLQMVIKSCVPAPSILKLIKPKTRT